MLFDTENLKFPIFFMSSIQTLPLPVSTTIRNVQECTQVENRKNKIKIKSYLHALFSKETKKVFLFGLTSFLALLGEVQEELLHYPRGRRRCWRRRPHLR